MHISYHKISVCISSNKCLVSFLLEISLSTTKNNYTLRPIYSRILRRHPSTQEPLACLRASANFSNYPTKLRKPHAAHKAVIGLLTTFFPESHFRFHAP